MKNESDLKNSANEFMENRRGNCAQAIFATYGPYLANKKLNIEECKNITSAFGGGINLTGNVCGALTGALMSLGLIFNGNMKDVSKYSTQFLEKFTKINGSIICRDLVGYEFSDFENLRPSVQKDVFTKCKKYVLDAACLLENIIDEQSIKEEN